MDIHKLLTLRAFTLQISILAGSRLRASPGFAAPVDTYIIMALRNSWFLTTPLRWWPSPLQYWTCARWHFGLWGNWKMCVGSESCELEVAGKHLSQYGFMHTWMANTIVYIKLHHVILKFYDCSFCRLGHPLSGCLLIIAWPPRLDHPESWWSANAG